MQVKFNLQAIPICLVALGLWAIIGGWYIAVAPMNLAGPDNIGIVLSVLGICLFVADRLAFLWLKVQCSIIFFKTWVWGLFFVGWGFIEWLHFLSRQYLSFFIIHWSMFLLIIAGTLLLIGRRRRMVE